MPVVIAAVALLGLAIGSFLNVVIHRVPLEASLSKPPSQCPRCGHAIRARHNVPVLGWLILRGRCFDCSAPISARYPLVELITAVLFVAVALRLGRLHLLPALPAFLTFTAIGVALTVIDLDLHRLPNSIVLPAYPVLALLLTMASVVSDSPQALVRAAIGGVSLYALYLLLALCYPAGMGFGDVKFAGLVGGMLAYISYPALMVGGFAAFLLGGIAGTALLVSRRGSRKSMMAFGPFMVAGVFVSLLVGSQIVSAYSDLVLST